MMVAYLKAGPQVRTYSDYLRATREAKKEDSIELSHSPRIPATDGPSKQRTTSFFPLRKLKGSQPFTKKPTIHAWHNWKKKVLKMARIWKVMTLISINGVNEEFMVWLARAVKDTQMDEKQLLSLQ